MERRPFLSPRITNSMIDVISTLCLPIASRIRFLVLKAAVVEVGVEAKYLGNLHGVHKFVSPADRLVAYQPITSMESKTLMVWGARSKSAILAKGIGSKPCVLANYV